MLNYVTISINEISKYYGDIQRKVYLSDERISHIKSHHAADYERYGDKIMSAIEHPDIVLDDHKNPMTAMFVKKIADNNINVVVKLAFAKDIADRSFVVTMHSIGNKGVERLYRKNKIVYNLRTGVI